MTDRFKITIDGRLVEADRGRWLPTENPFDGTTIAHFPRCDAADVQRAVSAARRASEYGDWAGMGASARGQLLHAAGALVAQRADELAALETRDTGKPIVESTAQMRGVADWFRYYGGLADKIQGAVVPSDPDRILNYTLNEPLGVVAAITPWNSPVMIAAWKIAPALAAGNTVVLKPSEHASLSTLAMMEVFHRAGFPPGVVNCVSGLADECGAPLVAHPDVAKVTFTGSDRGGRAINVKAAEQFKHVTLELGGKSPQVVFEDADIENAVHGIISGVFLSNGQTCVAGSRLYLQRSIAKRFVDLLVSRLRHVPMGDPFDPATRIGPIANRAQFDKVMEFIEEARAAGARCVAGGAPASGAGLGQGLFIEPTVFVDVPADARVATEEVFGPVLSVFEFDDEDEAVERANHTPYGLAAGVWTADIGRAIRMARRINSGTVYVNTYRSVSTTSPVGGYKQSGFGRENGIEAMREFLQTKSVWLGLADRVPNPLA